jgi:hypothetical protein
MSRAWFIPLGAILYRLRGSAGPGGWFEKLFGFAIGTFLGRFLWCVPVAYLLAETWLQFALYAILAYIGVMFGYWGGQFDLSLPKNRHLNNYLILTVRGGFIPLPLAMATGAWWSVAGGMLFVPCYLLGGVISRYAKLPLLHGHTEWGEALLAACIVGGIIL